MKRGKKKAAQAAVLEFLPASLALSSERGAKRVSRPAMADEENAAAAKLQARKRGK